MDSDVDRGLNAGTAPPQHSGSTSNRIGCPLLPFFRITATQASAHPPSPSMVTSYKGTAGGNTSPVPSTLYIPIASPPTPAPSPGPFGTHDHDHRGLSVAMAHFPHGEDFQQFGYHPTRDFSSFDEQARLEFLNRIIAQCTLRELSHVSALISPLLKRDFLQELPTELALHVLSYIDDLYELVRNVGGVCKHWRRLSNDDLLWRLMCKRWEFDVPLHLQAFGDTIVPGSTKRHFKVLYLQSGFTDLISFHERSPSLTHRYLNQRNEMASRWNASPKSATTDLTTRRGGCDVPGNG